MKKTFLHLLFTICILFSISASATETGDSCKLNEDCPSLHSCTNNICVHKKLFPLTGREVGSTIVIVIIGSLLIAGGVGGGAAYVPYIMLLFEVNIHQAIAYAYACVFGGGLGNIANIIFLKDPKTNRYKGNYDLNLIILPPLMIGVAIGGILQRIFPPLVTNILLLMVLAYSITKNFFKLKSTMKHERQERIEQKEKKRGYQKAVELARTEIQAPLSGKKIIPQIQGAEFLPVEKIQQKEQEIDTWKDANHHNEKETFYEVVVNNPIPQDPMTLKRLELEKKQLKYPFHKLGLLFINVIIIVLVGLIRGTKKFTPIVGIKWTCGWDFLWFGIAILLYTMTSALDIYFIRKWQQEKVSVGYEFLPQEPQLTNKRILKISLLSILAGCVGSIVALGGSLIISPSLLEMGVPPAYSAATTGLLLFFSMGNTTLSSILNQKITAIELGWFVGLTIPMSYIMSKLINSYVKRTGRQSIILLILLCITSAGVIGIVYNQIQGLVENASEQLTFTSVC